MDQNSELFDELQKRIEKQLGEISAINTQAEQAEAEEMARNQAKRKHTKLLSTHNIVNRMKRLLLFFSALMAIASGTWAQADAAHFTIDPPLPGGQSTETVVEAKLVTGTTLSGNLANYEIAALVDGHVRVIRTGNRDVNPAIEAAVDYNYFLFNIPGNFTTAEEDNGKAITFKMYNSTSGLEYDLTCQAITFDGAHHGTPSALVELSVTEVTGISAPARVHMNFDETYDISTQVSLTPAGATMPNNAAFTWDTGTTTTAPSIQVSADGKITSRVEPNGTILYGYVYTRLGSLTKSTDVQVHKHVKSVTPKAGITVNVGDVDGLTAALADAFNIEPEGYTDKQNLMSSSNSSVVAQQYSNGSYVYNPLTPGTATMYVSFYYSPSQTQDITTANGSVEVTVVQPVTSIYTNSNSIEANVGDNLTSLVNSLITVLPENATDKSYTFALRSGSTDGVLNVTSNSVTATGEGNAILDIASVSNPEKTCSLEVYVHNYAKTVQFDRQTHWYTYADQSFDISDDVTSFLQFGPTGYSDLYSFELTSSDEAVVECNYADNHVIAAVVGTGTATLTATLKYPNYLQIGADGTPAIQTVTATMQIVVEQGLTGFSLRPSASVNVGETLNLLDCVTLDPENFTLPADAYQWTIKQGDASCVTITGNTLTGVAPTTTEDQFVVLTLNIDGYKFPNEETMTVAVFAPATGITVNTPTITVNKGDEATLTAALNDAVSIVPANSTDVIVWASGNTDIVDLNVTNNNWSPKAGGTVTMTAYAGTYDTRHVFIPREGVTATVTVTVNVPVESITFSTRSAIINVGDDITDYLNSIVTILPEDATNKSFHFTVTGTYIRNVNGRWVAATAGLSQFTAVADDGSGVTSSNKIAFAIYSQAKDVTFAKDIIVKYTGSDIDISEEVKNNITYDPAKASRVNATLTSSNPAVAEISSFSIQNTATNTPVNTNVTATAKGLGEATITMTITYIDYLAELMDASGAQHRTTVERTFKVIVSQGLSGFEIVQPLPEPMAYNSTYDLILKPQPADAEFDPEAIQIWADDPADLGTQFFEAEFVEVNEEGNALFEVWANYPGTSHLNIRYDDGTVQLNVLEASPLTAGLATTLDSGWQWRTLWGPIGHSDIATHFQSAVDEVRSQTALMANDPVYGYYGDLFDEGLEEGVAYKINATTSIESWEAAIQTGGSYLLKDTYQPLQKAWTWIGNPYVLNHSIRLALEGVSEGDRIVSKEDGFAEWVNGGWVGSLTMLWPTQAYLYYNNSGAEAQLQWVSEPSLAQSGGGANPAPARRMESSWQYDASSFRDNMSMVAKLDEVTDPERFTIGAFVDDECRGEGRCIDGLMFITVHANMGEEVTFRVEDKWSGQQFDINETERAQLLRGSVKAPVHLTINGNGTATGIDSVGSSTRTATYDVSGRQLNRAQRGVNIVRKQDGTMKKVLVK